MGEPQASPQPRERNVPTPSEDLTKDSAGEGRATPWSKGDQEVEEGSFGRWLRRQREIREIDLREIADRTKISLRYLKAMEQDRFDLLPAPVFARGFLREYARYVGLSPDEVVNFYLSAHEDMEVTDEDETPARLGRSNSWRYGLVLALVVLLLAALAMYVAYYLENRRPEPADDSSASQSAAVAPAALRGAPIAAETSPAVSSASGDASEGSSAIEEPPSAPLEVTLDFTGECWVEAVIDGRQRISELHVQGESLLLAAQREVFLRKIGNAGGVEVQVNGRPFDLQGVAGDVVGGIRIDLNSLAALEGP
ncbi:MAG: helix-turn-helix domain-containing protein [Acidobacteriota bacterium]